MRHTSRSGHVDARRVQVYVPAVRPGFTAWVTAFDYGDGSVGVSFKETIQAENPHYEKPTLEMGEAAGTPVSYGAIDFASPHLVHERVYLRTRDGETYEETGRSPLDQGAFTNLGFPDGRIVGLEVRRANAARTGWADEIDVRESSDGGTTWTSRPPILRGTSPYLWRTRRLSDGTHIILASFYGTPWGADQERPTRNTMFPGETYLGKIQTFFLTTRDGREFSEPHYVLPGVGAHEYDVVERGDGSSDGPAVLERQHVAVLGVVDVDPTDAVGDPGADHSRPSERRSSGTQLGLRPSLKALKPSIGSGP